MLRNRNSFFQEASMNTQSFMPNMAYAGTVPYSSAQSSQSYYQGPMPNQNNYPIEDLEGRIAKLERQINRLDARISKLENSTKLESIDMSSNMYMV